MIADSLFAPVVSTTAFEETLERLSTAIKLGLLEPGARLPPERELCEQLGIARSTLRQALTALVQSGHLVALRGRAGGTFVADPPPALQPRPESLLSWRETCDTRVAVELGVAVLAAERASADDVERLRALVAAMAEDVEDFGLYRQADVRFHIGLAEATGSPALVAAMTETQGAMGDLFAHIAHPPEVLAWANAQHGRLVDCLRRRDGAVAVRTMQDHLRGSEHVLAGLLP
ncbi:FadR family transcriptional regulator [Solirubrobacter sp. CPCC 204708]|uniref:FCD domain-containing protein n=1 Tax=Solirubrobacter deserti TaxID=2282478 RepID=A0ABT4RGD9_9ACTN|nr:FCD domain-containing protein [Solirubrobacter deserti]MBE2319712.1 FadR family transcriptional regulator [Solirubrobacter deserti]MDA0137548.1 FCD domain-containing protein [Solirubrobacter deserti]